MSTKAARDLQPGDEAWLKDGWRKVRAVSPVGALGDDGIRPTSKVAVVWDPGQRFDNATLEGRTRVEVKEKA
ncbi:hypothetical protein [Amycolatopsis lexingtonensis]|uniref:hypothetical protein n=1 Tax=Amycolatopsis lexingtonensis TaxID=218822 RepID=UPI003F7169CF